MDRRKIHVVPNGNKWEVKQEGKSTPISSHNLKERAIENGKSQAKNAELGQILIHGQNGKIQTEHTYGKDPKSTKG